MKQTALLSAILLTLAATPLYASQELASKNGCMGCHLLDRKTVGPAILDIAKLYADQQDAAAILLAKVKNGGGGPWHGVWGQVPMPPNTQVQDEQLKLIVDWMLMQK